MAETNRICSVEGCNKPYEALGYCSAHYTRVRTHGNPMAHVPLRASRGEPSKFLEQVIAGEITSGGCIIWPYGRFSSGRAQISDPRYDTSLAYRVVCERVHGTAPTPDHEAAHSCGKGHLGCIAPHHLRWATSHDNHQDRKQHGTWRSGENHGSAKLTEADVREILRLKGEVGQRRLAKRYGVCKSLIGAIHRREIWTSLEEAA